MMVGEGAGRGDQVPGACGGLVLTDLASSGPAFGRWEGGMKESHTL